MLFADLVGFTGLNERHDPSSSSRSSTAPSTG